MTMMASCYFISQGRANLNKMISAFATSSPVQRPLLLKPNDRICLSSRGSRAHFHTTSMSLASELPTKISKTYELTPQKIGNSDLVMTEVSLGTMTWGEQNTEEEAHQQLDIAYERGVVGIDAAELYPVPPKPDTSGLTEKYIGSWIRKRGGTDFREKLVILSKVAGGSQGRRAIEWIRSANRRVDRKNILLAVDGILERLGTDYIDCLQIHWPDRVRLDFHSTLVTTTSNPSSVILTACSFFTLNYNVLVRAALRSERIRSVENGRGGIL